MIKKRRPYDTVSPVWNMTSTEINCLSDVLKKLSKREKHVLEIVTACMCEKAFRRGLQQGPIFADFFGLGKDDEKFFQFRYEAFPLSKSPHFDMFVPHGKKYSSEGVIDSSLDRLGFENGLFDDIEQSIEMERLSHD